MNKKIWVENKWVITTALVFMALLLLRRGGLAFAAPMARFIIPVLGIVLILRMIKSRIKSMAETLVREAQKNSRFPPREEQGEVIDLCPRCGAYMKRGHRC